MDKDEMKNRISLALKAPVLQQGFEIICRNLAELEKENEELKEQISTKDILIKELQEQKTYWKESSFDWRHKFFKLDKVKRLIKKDKQLAQAKEIIKRFSAIRKTPYLEGEEELFAEAEQFLKDCDIDNAIQQANKGLDFDKIADEMEQDLNSEVGK